MRNTPPGWPRISSALWYQDPVKAIDWLCQAFGFEIRMKITDDAGRIVHSELTYGDGVVMVGGEVHTSAHPERTPPVHHKSPLSVGGGNTQNMFVYVDDVDAHCARARAAGAVVVTEPTNSDYGEDHWEDRGYECKDLEGHHWWFAQRMRDPRA